MKTKRKYKAPIFLTLFFAGFLYLIVTSSAYKTDKTGILIISSIILFLMILYSLSKFVQIEIKNGTLIKNSLGYSRTIKMNLIYKYKQDKLFKWYHFFGEDYFIKKFLTELVHGKKYKNLRHLKIYYKTGLGTMSFDETTMTRLEFNKLISEVKKGKSNFHKQNRKKQITG